MIVEGDVLRWKTPTQHGDSYSYININYCKQDETAICVRPEHMTLSYVSSMMDNKSSPRNKTVKRTKKRTVTSYDYETSFYLKSVFFEVYSFQKKLTKQQRKEVQKKTGLASRNITYWFSNHKRRFYDTLKIYRKTIQESNGAIKNYKDFVNWRKKQGLPEQISQEEVDNERK